ncbi:hypothetical protein [Paraflavitalea sp. CAU 1676]|uniref:hypothetical protein n=1 Tax=Paraflavitalea sp. CAU 1676 TaxID=3032598 RepID=UPI0023DCA3AA|nr:hypothetical protein [Paraflavitalea sp. CAU 1676]MDF2190377.1 hypothetical protein [Paraflavitalea sp. CAU 1676]
MRVPACLFMVILLMAACGDRAAKPVKAAAPAAMAGVSQWFDAWNLVCRDKLGVDSMAAPRIFLYDDTAWYTTGDSRPGDTAMAIGGPGFSWAALHWWTAKHHRQLRIPDGQTIPVGLMSFAGADSADHPFFVMAVPGYWKQAGVESKTLGIGNLVTAVFLHEFAHTRQQTGMGAAVTAIEKEHSFGDVPLSDDIVQDLFKGDSTYHRQWRAEADKFYEAAFATDTPAMKRLTREALTLLQRRQATWFTGDRAILQRLDDIFLTMEGLGQYTGFYWLQHPSGGKFDYATSVDGMRRKRNQWSQEEGLALFLILDKLASPGWTAQLLSDHPPTIITLLTAASQ